MAVQNYHTMPTNEYDIYTMASMPNTMTIHTLSKNTQNTEYTQSTRYKINISKHQRDKLIISCSLIFIFLLIVFFVVAISYIIPIGNHCKTAKSCCLNITSPDCSEFIDWCQQNSTHLTDNKQTYCEQVDIFWKASDYTAISLFIIMILFILSYVFNRIRLYCKNGW